MNNYEERLGHKRVRMEADGPAGLVQGNGLPVGYMGESPPTPTPSRDAALAASFPERWGALSLHNGHQIPYQPYAGSYNAHYPPSEVTFGAYGPGGDLAGYASRSLGYAPPAHQAYPAPPQTSAFIQQQQQQMLHSGVPYEQHHHQHAAHKATWPPQPLMQPIQLKVKQEIKVEPSVPLESAGPSVISMRSAADPHIVGETDAANQNRRGVITDSGDLEKSNPDCDPSKIRQVGTMDSSVDVIKNLNENSNLIKDPNLDMLGSNQGMVDAEGGKSRISDSGNSTDSANKNKFQGSEDETKIPNEIYFGTPDISTYRPKMMTAMHPMQQHIPMVLTTPATPLGPAGLPEVKKRGRPKGSCNKPKPPGTVATPRPQAGRPRGGGHSSPAFYPHTMRPFKRDFSGIRFKRRWSDDGLDSSHIPNEVYFGDYPVPMEVLFNYYDSNAEKERHHKSKHHHHHQQQPQTPGNVTLVYSSSDSSSDNSSDSDSSDTDNEPIVQTPMKRGPGRPRGSKTINRRSDGQRLSSGSPGDRPPGITEMKRFLKIAGIEYDYTKLVEGCLSNKERVAALMNLLEAKGLNGPPTVEACRSLYTGPPPRRRGPKPGTKRTPKTSIATLTDDDPPSSPKTATPPGDEELRRITRGQTSGKPRQRIVISSDEEDSHTPLSKLRTIR